MNHHARTEGVHRDRSLFENIGGRLSAQRGSGRSRNVLELDAGTGGNVQIAGHDPNSNPVGVLGECLGGFLVSSRLQSSLRYD